MKIAVIVPTFNRLRFLPVALRSILMQQVDADLDVIVVDDGSTDGTADWLATQTDPRLRWLHQPNGGVSAARNEGLARLARGTGFVTFLDSDDAMPAGRLAHGLALLGPAPEGHPDAAYAYGRMSYTESISDDTLAPPSEARQTTLRAIQLACGLYRRELIDRIGPFDTCMAFGEDTDYLFRIFESGAQFVEHDETCLYYRRHSGNVTNDIATNRSGFMRALSHSLRRRKADPNCAWVAPNFALAPRNAAEALA